MMAILELYLLPLIKLTIQNSLMIQISVPASTEKTTQSLVFGLTIILVPTQLIKHTRTSTMVAMVILWAQLLQITVTSNKLNTKELKMSG